MTKVSLNMTCPFCDKKGLPILPVRYAITRCDRSNTAPCLPVGFGQGVISVPLPETACYTLRLLRSGFLYTFDERRKEWRAYVVNDQSYLYEFHARAKAPPIVADKTFNDACKIKGDPYKARCFTVKDAATATRVWIGFSDVAWTADVLKEYTAAILGTSARSDAAERKQSLQCIDVAAWRSGQILRHVATFDELKRVAEFVADGEKLKQDTYEYLKRFMPPPYTSPQDLRRTDEVTRKAVALMSPMVKDLLPFSLDKAPTEGRIDCAAWKFSVQPFRLASNEKSALRAWGNEQAKPMQPIMLGVLDPAGIAIDLNGLAIQHGIEFTDVSPRRWKFETAQLIAGLKEAVGNGAVEAKKSLASTIYQALLEPTFDNPAPALMPPSMRKEQEEMAAELEREALRHIEGRAEQIAEETWTSDYETRLKPDGRSGNWTNYVEVYKAELEEFANSILMPLDQAFVDWLRHPSLARVFKFHYDPTDLRSGEAYLELAYSLIEESGGRQKAAQWLYEQIQQDPTNADAWLMRSFALNHEPLIGVWKQSALDAATKSGVSWADVAEKFHDKLKDIVTSGGAVGPGDGYLSKLERQIYQISGPLIQRLSNGVDKGAAALLPTSMQMSLLISVAQARNPNLVVVDLRGEWSRKQAVRTVSRLLASINGGNENKYRSGVRAVFEDVADAEGVQRPYRAVLLIDKAKIEELLPGKSGGALKAGISAVVTPRQFEAALQESVGKVFSLEAKAGVVQMILSAVTLHIAYRDMIKAGAAEKNIKVANFAGGVVALTGLMSGVVGKSLEQTRWGTSPLSRSGFFSRFGSMNRSGWLIGIGKYLGAIGGVIGGGVAIREGAELYSGNHASLGLLLIFAGGVSAALSVFVIFSAAGGPVGLVVGLVICVVMLVVAWLTPNKVQAWLEQSLHFGKGPKKFFDGPLSQMTALEVMMKGD